MQRRIPNEINRMKFSKIMGGGDFAVGGIWRDLAGNSPKPDWHIMQIDF